LQVPSNISLLPLPPRSPELNAQENIWQFMRNRCGGITYKFCARVEMKWSVLIDGGCGDGWHGER
jgi:hypothetical protein